MKKVFNLILLISLSGFVFSCNKSDDVEVVPLRDYAEQYATDIEKIKDFLKTHSITIVNHPGFEDDQNISFTEVPELDPTSIWGTDDAVHKADVLEWPVERNGFTYIVYYLSFRQGLATGNSPTNYDQALVSYKGFLVNDDITNFETDSNPQAFSDLGQRIIGWGEIIPKFKTGGYVANPDGTISYTDFGAGVMFLPSGLAYFNVPKSSIPSYSSLIFGFKLFEVKRNDHDGDGIYSYLEDVNGDGYLRDDDTTYEDDTDHDGAPDFLDRDDDGDNFLTRYETEYTIGTTKYYYPFQGALVDDPLTPQNETLGIPSCGATPDYTSSTRLRKHLDPSCH